MRDIFDFRDTQGASEIGFIQLVLIKISKTLYVNICRYTGIRGLSKIMKIWKMRVIFYTFLSKILKRFLSTTLESDAYHTVSLMESALYHSRVEKNVLSTCVWIWSKLEQIIENAYD